MYELCLKSQCDAVACYASIHEGKCVKCSMTFLTEPRSLLVAKLVPNRSPELDFKSGCETWGVAFSPDGSYFAWSQGYNIVKLIPWPLEDRRM